MSAATSGHAYSKVASRPWRQAVGSQVTATLVRHRGVNPAHVRGLARAATASQWANETPGFALPCCGQTIE